MQVIGLDLSYSATGVAHADGTTSRIVTVPTQPDPARWRAIRNEVLDLIDRDADGVVVVIEDLPAARAHGIGRTGMLHGVIRLALADAVDTGFVQAVVFVPPASLKRYATGKGNAGKPQVMAEAIRRLDYQGSDDNEADALWLRQLGLARYAPDLAVAVPQTHLRALDGIAWPDLEERVA